MRDGESLTEHATDGKPDQVHLAYAEEVERRRDVVGKRGHRVVAGDGRAAAMPAHVETQNAEARSEQRRQLLHAHMPPSDASECVKHTTAPFSGPARS